MSSPATPPNRFKIDWITASEERAKSGHALFGASTIDRFSRCNGSTAFSLVNNAHTKDTEYTREGKAAHALGERAFVYKCDATDFVGKKIMVLQNDGNYEITVEADMAEYVQQYLDWCRVLKGVHFVETQVDLSRFSPIPHQFGTADHACINEKTETLTVTDLKYGRLFVDVVDNRQLLAYALGFYYEYRLFYSIKHVVLRIAQPRLESFIEWKITAKELRAYGPKLHEWISQATSPQPSFLAGEKQCRWCPMSGNCSVEADFIKDTYMGDFDSFDENKPVQREAHTLTIAELERSYSVLDQMADWMNAIRTRLSDAINAGESTAYKQVEGRMGDRQWADEQKAVKWMTKHGVPKEKIYEKKLISPAKCEKMLPTPLRGTEVTNQCTRAPGKPKIVPITDPRPAYTPAMDDLLESPEFGE